MNSFGEKRAARIKRLKGRAERVRDSAEATYKEAHDMANGIPLGQPIITGRGSRTRADINFRNKIRSKFEKSFEQIKYADELARRVEAAENNNAISSDDPNAIQKLEAKLAKEITDYEELKRKAKEQEVKLPPYVRANTTSRIRAIKQRIETLKKRAERKDKEYEIGEIRVVESISDNRVRIYFPDKPDTETRSLLKRNGFRWSPSNGAWQAYLSSAYKIKSILGD